MVLSRKLRIRYVDGSSVSTYAYSRVNTCICMYIYTYTCKRVRMRLAIHARELYLQEVAKEAFVFPEAGLNQYYFFDGNLICLSCLLFNIINI